ncbi:GDSL-type esterase/lipase family protein [Muribaculum sp.]|uniref:GDSL-type esterase/lipase family protein n=1 Tax=Muribaculum sp. TaxID=1918611 RepID=UPI0023C03F6D|nr:GDSL-type esterase/lipase family protein [Muribaculum sp.]MDE5705770.1 hypothetical protein [Muribaculum sp.]
MKRLLILLATTVASFANIALSAEWHGTKSKWHGADRYDFTVAGRSAIMVVPDNPLPGNPWIWRPAFFDAFPSIDIALLDQGYHIAYYNVTDEWARPSSIRAGKEFYDFAVEHGLMDKVVMEGLSRGAYYSLRFAQTYPEHIGALLLDNPLVDINELRRNNDLWNDVTAKWRQDSLPIPGLAENAACNLSILVDHKIPVVILSGGSDTIVPYERNGKLIKDAYRRWNIPVKSIVRPHSGHHPHGIDNPYPIAEYISECLYGKLYSRPMRVACIGDSMTEGVGTDDFATQSYPAQLQALLGPEYEVGNFGVSCATMLRKGTDAGRPFGYSTLPAMHNVIDFNPDIIIIALGVNDCKSYNWEKLNQEFTADYQSLIDTLNMLPSLPEIYLVVEPYVQITPQTLSWGFEDKGYYEQMREHINTVAIANRMNIISLTDVFKGEEAYVYAPNDHPNPRGAMLMAKAIKASLP